MIKKNYTVPEQLSGTEVRKFLIKIDPAMPFSRWRDAFAKKDVKVNGKRVRERETVCAGDEVTVFLPEENNFPVVYEDDRVLLCVKKQGILSESNGDGTLSMEDLARAYTARKGEKAYLCHRLDAKTGGLLLFAKDEEALACLEDAFYDHRMEKEYLCLVQGTPVPESAVLESWIVKDAAAGRVRVLRHEAPDALPIRTGYEVILPGEKCLVRVHLYTGRTHQIRAQMAAIGHPVLGDELYGDRETNRKLGVRNLKLWSVLLTFGAGGALSYLDGRSFSCKAPFETEEA